MPPYCTSILPPSPLLSPLHSPSLIPSTVLSAHLCAPPPPPIQPLTAYFCLICPHCKVDCYQRGESKAGPGSVSVIVIFNVRNFNFQSFYTSLPPFSPLFFNISLPPPPPPLVAHPSWEFVNFVSLCLSLSFILSPNTYWLLSCLMSSPDFCHTECNFLLAASVMRSK